MIEIAGTTIDFTDPVVAGLTLVAVLMLILIVVVARQSGRSTEALDPMLRQMSNLSETVRGLSDGQHQLHGGLRTVADAQVQAQGKMLQVMEARLAEVQKNMSESLHGSSVRTTRSLTELQERLATIDKAQHNIEKLSGDVLSLQDILSNKQTRGAFGEIQLTDIVSKALPSDSYALQVTLSNGKRADCLIHLPNPPGPIVIDSKFPLEPYERLVNAPGPPEAQRAMADLRTAVRAHIKAIAEKYIIEGETADGAIMFLPSEAVYAELHARLPEVVREGFAARVWIVSPTTCMATLHTMRAILKDARMREQAGAIRKTLHQLHRDVELVVERVGKLDTHFRQAREDLEGIGVAAERAGKRAARLDNFDFEELAPDTAPESVVSLHPPGKQ
jgi:DNA recombination protein RmuC